MAGAEWRKTLNWVYPYSTHTLSDPKYIKDRDKLFEKNGYGWWYDWTEFKTPLPGIFSEKDNPRIGRPKEKEKKK